MSDTTTPPAAASPGTALAIVRGGRQRKLLSEPILFEETALPGFMRAGLAIVAGLVLVFLVWAAIARVDSVATGAGAVLPSPSIRTVQLRDGGILAELKVTEGQKVVEGQVLLRLDGSEAGAELDRLQARHTALLLRAERLKAVAERRKPDFTAVPNATAEQIAEQARAWQDQLAARKGAALAADTQAEQKRREIKLLRETLVIAQQQFRLAADQAVLREKAAESGAAPREAYLDAARAKIAAEAETSRLREQVQAAQDQLAEAERRRASLDATVEQDALAELATITAEAGSVAQAIAKSRDRLQGLEVKAPAAGTVQDLRVGAPGEAMAAGIPLMRVAQANAMLEAELRIDPRDIGSVQVGQAVRLKVTGYDRQGMVPGKVARIAPNAVFDDQNGKPYYRVTVALGRTTLGAENQHRLLPGMAVEGDVVTGQMAVLRHLLKPVLAAR